MGHVQAKFRSSKFGNADSSSAKSADNRKEYVETVESSPVVVWCDQSIGSSTYSQDIINSSKQLGNVLNRRRKILHQFNEETTCREFITDVNDIFLIVSGAMGRKLVPSIHHLEQINSIYIFCMQKKNHELWATQYSKIRGVFVRIDELCDSLKEDFFIETLPEEPLRYDIFNKNISASPMDVYKREFPVIYPIISKLILFNTNSIEQNDMINYYRAEYSSKNSEKTVNQFEQNYSRHSPLWWFTRDSFFQEIINRALQMNDLSALFMMSPFLKDINKQLTALQKKQLPSYPNTIEVYASRTLSKTELESLKGNKDGIICINEFLFANTNEAITLASVESQMSSKSSRKSINVLLKISISKAIGLSAVYAHIGAECEFVHEDEYLISLSSIFQISKIEPHDKFPSLWLVHLSLVNRNDPQLDCVTQFISSYGLFQENSLSDVSREVPAKVNQFKSTRKLFEQVLNFGTKQIRSILLNYNMGIIYDALRDYDQALRSYQYAFGLTQHSGFNDNHKDNLCLVPLYSCIGLAFQHLNTTKPALDNTFRALSILSNHNEVSPFKAELFASCYFNLGVILELQGDTCQAKSYYEAALKSRSEHLSDKHPDVINLQNIINSMRSRENQDRD